MAERRPRTLILEYEDGSKATVEFASLPALLQFDILRQPFAGGATPNPSEGGAFVLLEWEDGWKEVFQIGPEYTDVMRYYVITRSEDVGRLSFAQSEGYPELLELVRRPLGVRRIAFDRDYLLQKGVNRREGKKYEQEFQLVPSGEPFARELEAFREAAAEAGRSPEELVSLEGDELTAALDEIRRRMGLAAGRRQRDVLNFVAYLARMAAAS